MGLIDDLGAGPIGLDTAVVIYLIEEHPIYADLVAAVFHALDSGDLTAVTSTLTLLECLVVPFRNGDLALAARYEAILSRSRGLELVDLHRSVLRSAARLRAALGLTTPDALQVATALHKSATAFLTNDRRLPDVPGLPILQLSDYLPASSR